MIATSGFLTALECMKFVFGRSSDPAYSAPPGPLAGFRGSTSKRKERGEGEGRERGEEGKGKEREGPPFANSRIRP